jgi:hypothetical protein
MTDLPKRIQRRRIKGWRMPKGAVNCTRPGRYGNPYIIGVTDGGFTCTSAWSARIAFECDIAWNDRNSDRLMNAGLTTEKIQQELRGKDLVCWCRLDSPDCHVDYLLETANA